MTVDRDFARLLEAHRAGDPDARERIVERYMPLVRSVASRYAGRGEPLEDLVQVGSIGLVLAIERFDLEAASDQTLRLNFEEVRNLSGTDAITVYGEAGDHVFLDNNVPGSAINGGQWVAGPESRPNSEGETYQTYQYVDSAGDYTGISVTVDTEVQVTLV